MVGTVEQASYQPWPRGVGARPEIVADHFYIYPKPLFLPGGYPQGGGPTVGDPFFA